MFENIIKFFNKTRNKEEKKDTGKSKNAAKERLHLVLMQDRANVSADFLELMKQEIIDVIKKYIEVDEKAIDVRLTNKENDDGTNGAPALYANIPIVSIKNEARKVDKKQIKDNKEDTLKEVEEEQKSEENEIKEKSVNIEKEQKQEDEKDIEAVKEEAKEEQEKIQLEQKTTEEQDKINEKEVVQPIDKKQEIEQVEKKETIEENKQENKKSKEEEPKKEKKKTTKKSDKASKNKE